MTTRQTTYSQRFTDSFIGAIVGLVISETARQLVQYDNASMLRVFILVISSLAGGGLVAFSFSKSNPRKAVLDMSHEDE